MEPLRIGAYRLEDRIGAGGMGIVYRAFDERLDRWVAVKIITPGRNRDLTQRERLRREARANARLNHPAVVRIYDLVQTDEVEAIVMELVEGRPLADVLRDGPVELGLGLVLARDVADALVAAHAHGIVHRDLKAENVLVTPEGRAKVLDFGIAKQLGESEVSLTASGMVVGTYRSMAPEQAEGASVDHRSDLFSLGLLLYELFTGRSPFLASGAAATLHRVCYHRQPAARTVNPQLPEALSALIDHLLEKEPSRRPRNAGEVARDLIRIAGEAQGAAAGDLTSSTDLCTLVELRPELRSRPTPASAVTAERRQVTALCCSLVRADGQPLDPEEILDQIPTLSSLVAEVVRRFEGHLGPSRSHSWLAYFGYPRAHEDDARRAVNAALELLARSASFCSGNVPLALRIGLHAGAMVTKISGDAGELTLGETPEIAAVVQSQAAPGAVLASQTVHGLTRDFFKYEPLEPIPSSAARPLRLYRVLAGNGAYTRIEASRALTPLVGREQELGLLLNRWALAKEGQGQAVLLAGEAGLGKSRLIWELKQRVAAEDLDWLEGYGSPYHHDSVLYPILQCLAQWIHADRQTDPGAQLSHLEETLSQHGLPLAEMLPLLAALLSLPTGERHALPAMSPEVQRKKTLAALLAVLLAAAERQPLLLVIEDLHWIDSSTLELLGQVIDHLATAPLLLLLTSRPEFRPPWASRAYVAQWTLSPLTRSQAGLMVERLTAGRRLSSSVGDQITARTDGVPLFIEELTKMIVESGGTDASRPAEIPGTIEGWFRARLDRLDTAKEVAQLASTLGREFSAELMRAVSPWSEAALERELERLVQAEILYRRGLPPRQRYIFKHALLQDAAYASLLRNSRQTWHRRIAETMEERFPEIAESEPELLAHHYTEAAIPERALPFWQRAGEKAVQGSADQEAIGHLTRALAVLALLPESTERDLQEIAIQVNLGVAQGHCEGYGRSQAQEAYARAWELCGKVGWTPQIFPVVRGLFVSSIIRGDIGRALEIGRKLQDLAEAAGDPQLLRTSYQSVGISFLMLGQLVPAREYLEKAVELQDPDHSSQDAHLPGSGDTLVESLGDLAWTLWFLGFPDQAVQRGRQSVAVAQRFPYPFTLGFALYFESEVHAFRREPEGLEERCALLLQLADEQGVTMALPPGRFLRGWAWAEQGRIAEGLAEMREGLEIRRSMDYRVALPHHLAMFADVCLRQCEIEEGLAAVEEGLALAVGGQQGNVEAELYRLRGELLALQGASSPEVEEQLRRALDLSRDQGAKSFELRAAMSLARRWSDQGKKGEARDLLSEVYGWFTEGFDTRDLRETRALLDELAG